MIKNVVKVYFGDSLSNVLAVISMVILIRNLGVSDYSTYTTFSSMMSLIAGVIGGGINNSLVRFSAEYYSRYNRKPYDIYITGLALEILIITVFAAFSLLFFDEINMFLFKGNIEKETLILSSLSAFGIVLIQVKRSVFQSEERFSPYAAALILRQISILLILVFLTSIQLVQFKYVASTIALVNVVLGVALASTILQQNPIHSLKRIFPIRGNKEIKAFLNSTKWLIAYNITIVGIAEMGTILLTRHANGIEIAKYGVAYRYYALTLLILGSIHAVLLPRFSQVDLLDNRKQLRFVVNWIKISIWFGIPVLLFILFGKQAFVWVNGIQYADSFPILCILLLGSWMSLILSPLVNVLFSRKQFQYLFSYSLIAFFLNIFGNSILIPSLGGVGAAIITVLSALIVNFCALIKILDRKNHVLGK